MGIFIEKDMWENVHKIIAEKKIEMLDGLMKMTKDELIDEIRLWPDEDVADICEWLAMEHEAYEICHAAQIVKNERGLK